VRFGRPYFTCCVTRLPDRRLFLASAGLGSTSMSGRVFLESRSVKRFVLDPFAAATATNPENPSLVHGGRVLAVRRATGPASATMCRAPVVQPAQILIAGAMARHRGELVDRHLQAASRPVTRTNALAGAAKHAPTEAKPVALGVLLKAWKQRCSRLELEALLLQCERCSRYRRRYLVLALSCADTA